jgi:predicted aminopeptidase
VKTLLALLAAVLLAGCESLSYYSQAIGGHFQLLAAARPIDDWLADPATPADLKARLEAAQQIREFASHDLHLPQNRSYTSYADLDRRYAVWNVFAAAEFSVEPKAECFPFTGCVAYRGFFSEKEANRYAESLRKQGYDVYVGGVLAYSTLGWFDDPLLSTFIRYPEAQVARLVFHELAHQLVYAKNDTMFNESFAVTVEEEGVRRWLEAQHRTAELEAFRAGQQRKREFYARLKETRERLKIIYASHLSRDEMLEQKRGEFERLRAAYPGVVPAEPNNAFLVSVALYTELVPAFERLLAASGSDLDRFYARVRELAHEPAAQRDAVLARAS